MAEIGMPVLAPADPADILRLGLHGIALSRFCGLWTGLKLATTVVDGAGELVSARKLPEMFRIVARSAATGDGPADADLLLTHPDAEPLALTRPGAGERDVSLFGSTHLRARPVGEAADAWLRAVLRRDDLSLVWCDDPTRRTLSPEHSRPGDHAAFQDGYPVTVLSTVSVAQVNSWIDADRAERGEEPAAPLPPQRFRANLVLDGVAEPFAEDGWARVRIGDVVLRHARQVSRCVMTTIDPDDLSRGKDPIRALARHRNWDGKTWCAVALVPETSGTVAVGDEVVVEVD